MVQTVRFAHWNGLRPALNQTLEVSIMHMREFLNAVITGKTGFQPESESITDLSAFQITEKIAREAYNLNFIEYFKPHYESSSAHRFCDLVLASGITDKGREYLEDL
jgi:hypothetical protein